MQTSEALAMPSWLKIIRTKGSNQTEKLSRLSRLDQKSFRRTTEDVNLFKIFLAIFMAFLEFAHPLWEESKSMIVLADIKSVARFFQTKAIPSSLWNACDYVLQFNFKIAHFAGSVNTAADFPSRLELKVTKKIHRKIREDVQTTLIEVTTSSSDVADEEQFFFTQTDSEDESQEETFQRKEQKREKQQNG